MSGFGAGALRVGRCRLLGVASSIPALARRVSLACILAEGAIALSVTLSGGALFAS